jgi:predicted RNase H-like HicB family nuclease
MTTLIAVYTSEGCVGRCDAKCYDAAEPDCDCICQGRNHGAGKQQALDNTRDLAESWLEHARANGQDITLAELAVDAQHEPLFDLGGVS